LFKKGFLKAIMFLSVISFPILGCIGLFAHEFIMIFLGEKWMQMKIPLILLVPMGMLKSVGTLKGAVLMACGRPDIELKWNIAYFLPLLLAVYFGTRYGLAGVAAAFTGLYLLTFPVIQTITNRLVKVSAREFCKTLTPASLGITVMIGIVLLFKYIAFSFLHLELLTVFILGLILACTGYLTVIWLMNREFLKEIVHLVLFNKSKMSAKQELLDIKVGS
jgi:O-antigen/teichoic acid export membrane protein